MTSDPPAGKSWVRAAAIVLAVAAAAFAVWRGPLRAMANISPPSALSAEEAGRLPRGSSDLSLVWMSTRAWIEGASPYTVESTGRVWAEHAGEAHGPPSERINALLVYPPSTFAVMAPWCAWDWPRSALLWAATNTILLITSAVLALGLAGLRPRQTTWWFALAGMLLLAPGSTAISVGQVPIPALFLTLLAQVLRLRGRPGWSGALLGIACAVKPQVAILFLLYEFGRKRWTAGLTGAAVAAAFLGLGIWQLHRSGIDWVPQWRANLEAFAGSDNANPTSANPLRYQLINLHYLVHGFVPGVQTVKAIVYAACGGLCLAYSLTDLRRRESRAELTSLSFVAVIAMLIVYHRIYDAVVLLLPAAWVAREWASGRRSAAMWVSLLGLAAFLLPGASILKSLSGRLPAAVSGSWVFESILMPHAVIALLGLASALLVARRREGAEERVDSGISVR